MGYARPTSLTDALALMAETRWTVLAGGTDLYPATTARGLSGNVLDINALSDLRGISEQPDHWRIGARVTWTELLGADLPPAFDALRQAAREVGSVQIQNTATIAGNLCNASPAADGVPALLVVDTQVELRNVSGVRVVALDTFLTGPRRTERRPEELVTAILIPKASCTGMSVFSKLGARKYLVISIAMIAARLSVTEGAITSAAIAVGACSVQARRLLRTEASLIGQPVSALDPRALHSDLNAVLSPIDDVRATSEYRMTAAATLIERSLHDLAARLS